MADRVHSESFARSTSERSFTAAPETTKPAQWRASANFGDIFPVDFSRGLWYRSSTFAGDPGLPIVYGRASRAVLGSLDAAANIYHYLGVYNILLQIFFESAKSPHRAYPMGGNRAAYAFQDQQIIPFVLLPGCSRQTCHMRPLVVGVLM